jgi:flagellar biosynthesis/type III secretory pathway M-ring protein FliF/YscJ
MLDASDEMLQKIEENDRYMQQKVSAQLDRLIGKDNYVVTVATHLRQSPGEKVSITYDTENSTPLAEQTFTEGLGDQTSDSGRGTNAVSVYLPNGLPGGASDSQQNRNYNRTAREVQYGVSKVQETEFSKAGIMQEISIAVTLDKNALPENTTLEELRELIARAASPMVNAANVTLAFSDSDDPYLSGDRPSNRPHPDESGNPWWVAIGLAVIGSMVLLKLVADKIRKETEASRREVEILREQNAQQDQLISTMNQQAQVFAQQQSQLQQGLGDTQSRIAQLANQATNPIAISKTDPKLLEDALNTLADDLSGETEELPDKIKSWIEAV